MINIMFKNAMDHNMRPRNRSILVAIAEHIMPLFKNILCPIDESPKSNETLRYAFEIARLSKCKLILLYAFRLDQDNLQLNKKKVELKEHIKESTEEKLAELKQRFNLNGEVDFEFHSEIGFLASRVLLKFRDHPIDLIILSKELLHELNGRKEDIRCSMLLI